jgi:hypothetical protein
VGGVLSTLKGPAFTSAVFPARSVTRITTVRSGPSPVVVTVPSVGGVLSIWKVYGPTVVVFPALSLTVLVPVETDLPSPCARSAKLASPGSARPEVASLAVQGTDTSSRYQRAGSGGLAWTTGGVRSTFTSTVTRSASFPAKSRIGPSVRG